MSLRQSIVGWGSILILLSGVLFGPALLGQGGAGPRPETLLPAGTLLYVGWDGIDAHDAAWKKTAAHDALVKSGLVNAFGGLVKFAEREAGEAHVRMVMSTLEHLGRKGLYLAIAAPVTEQGPPLPQLTLVLPGAGGAAKEIGAQLANLGARDFQTQTVDSRQVTRGRIPEFPVAELGWWAEGPHLVITVGIGAVDAALQVAAGKSPNLTTNAVWKKYQGRADFETAFVKWVDLGGIRQLVAPIPVPGSNPSQQPTSVGEILNTLGLGNIGPVAFRFGFKEAALWSELTLEAPGPRTGILGFADQKPISLSDLPPLPAATDGFYAGRLDWSKAVEGMLRLSGAFMKQFAPPDAPSTEQLLAQVRQATGVDLLKDVLEPLGDVMVLYGDTRQGMFGMGIGLAVSVDDPSKLRKSVDALLARLGEEAGREARVKSVQRGKRVVQMLEFPDAPFISPSLVVDDKWLVLGLFPQTVDSYLLRQDGKLPRWESPEAVKTALAELPKSYTSITFSDPREGLRTVIGLAPTLLSFAQMSMMQQRQRFAPQAPPVEAPLALADFPPAELVTQSLFPNVSVCSVSPSEIRWTSRSSFPAVPLLGGAGIGSGGASAPILAALLLPAVQQAREAARRAQSSNNLRQIALALHNFHDTYRAFPAGTHQNDRLKAEKRLSWISDILPYLDQAPLYNQVDFKKAWDDKENEQVVRQRIPMLLNPGVAATEDPARGATHYVGMAGVGKDAPTLPVTDRRAGVFGYNRVTAIQNITDGTSNTIGVTEASGDYGPWSAGGPATIRALTKKPYINGPDGIGGPYRGGVHVMMMDGSVRFVNENIDPGTFEALTTISGGEAIGNF
jgi:Protein of unknown function (DUF1559)